MPSYRKVSMLKVFPSLIRISGQDKLHLHSRHLASYLVYGSGGVVQAYSMETWISETILLKREFSGRDHGLILFP